MQVPIKDRTSCTTEFSINIFLVGSDDLFALHRRNRILHISKHVLMLERTRYSHKVVLSHVLVVDSPTDFPSDFLRSRARRLTLDLRISCHGFEEVEAAKMMVQLCYQP